MTISIITPSYGQLDWLRLCVASVADQIAPEKQVAEAEVDGRQSRTPLETQSPISNLRSLAQSPLAIEHIVQDGGTPGIEEFARELGAEFYRDGKLVFGSRPSTLDPRLYRLAIYSESDAGMYDALNKAMARMSGDLWAWLNSDEQYLPGTLGYVSSWFAEHPESDILCGDALLTDEVGNALSYRRIVRPHWRHTRLVHLSSLSCASFYRRSIVEKVGGFDTTWRSIGDAEWMARMLQANISIQACGRLLSTFAFTGQNTSESPAAKKESQQWKRMTGAPSEWLRIPVIFHHRIRKWMAGAYSKRYVTYSIYGRNGAERSTLTARYLGWDWPSEGTSKIGQPNLENGVHVSQTIRVLGTSLLATTYQELSRLLIKEVRQVQRPFAVDFANTQIVTMRKHDTDFALLAGSVDITVPDGMPLVWAMNTKGAGMEDRVYGPTFTREFMASCPKGMMHYLIGGSDECGRRFREQMLQLNPSLNFVGGYHGECSVEGLLKDDETVLREIQESKPDFIWVGLGTPKQYGWIHRIKPQLSHGVMLAVGFAFDVNAGMKPDAPLWMQRIGMTWLFRMASEPERLAGRYFKWNTLFLWYWALECLATSSRKYKLSLRKLLLLVTDFFASDIRDCVTGDSLGRGLVLGWSGRPWIIGHEGLPPLIPRFLSQKRLTYWKQAIGFTTHARPDFPRLTGTHHILEHHSKVINVVLTHLGGSSYRSILEAWRPVCSEENLWIAFGGTRQDFESIDYPRKVFVEDPDLRKIDNQREKQSYIGIFQAMASVVERENADFIYFCEYDHLPLVPDLNRRQIDEMLRNDADVMGHWLYRIDGSSNYHMLFHESDPDFLPFWKLISRREDHKPILSMFGSGSLWNREAFLSIASQPREIHCYMELYLPSLAHHLGFRVRGWDEANHLISNLPSPSISVAEGERRHAWTVHPVKEFSAEIKGGLPTKS